MDHSSRVVIYDEAWFPPRGRSGRSAAWVVAAAVLAAVVLLAVVADPAMAADGKTIGKNIGDTLKGIAVPVFGGVVAVVAIYFAATRQVTQLAVFIVIAMAVGWLVTSPDSVAGSGRDVFGGIFGK